MSLPDPLRPPLGLAVDDLHALSAVAYGGDVIDRELDERLRALAITHPALVKLREPKARRGKRRALVYAETTPEGHKQILFYLSLKAGEGKVL